MSVVSRTPCPKCRSRGQDRTGDNLVRYTDGHAHCYACGYTEKASVEHRLQPVTSVTTGKKICQIPDDAIYYIPERALNWLKNFGIRQEEIKEHRFQWSESRQMLIMPVYDPCDNILMWQGRNFKLKKVPIEELSNGPSASQLVKGYSWSLDGPKYHTEGEKSSVLHIIKPNNGPNALVVVTEDLLSAIKVGRVWPAMPLWGSDIGLEMIRRLKERFWSLGIWLDEDKTTHAVKLACRASQVMPTFVIQSTQDPKYYPEDMIYKMVHHAGKLPVNDVLTRMEKVTTTMDIAETTIDITP
jgi:hypothetical protein